MWPDLTVCLHPATIRCCQLIYVTLSGVINQSKTFPHGVTARIRPGRPRLLPCPVANFPSFRDATRLVTALCGLVEMTGAAPACGTALIGFQPRRNCCIPMFRRPRVLTLRNRLPGFCESHPDSDKRVTARISSFRVHAPGCCIFSAPPAAGGALIMKGGTLYVLERCNQICFLAVEFI